MPTYSIIHQRGGSQAGDDGDGGGDGDGLGEFICDGDGEKGLIMLAKVFGVHPFTDDLILSVYPSVCRNRKHPQNDDGIEKGQYKMF